MSRFLLLLALHATAAHAQLPHGCVERIRAAILVHDTIYPGSALPEAIEIALRRKDLAAYFRLHAELWHQTFRREAIAAIVVKLRDGGTLTADEAAQLKLMRAALKQLRFAFVAFSAAHEAPRAVNRLATVTGKLQDAVKNARADLALAEGDRALAMLTPKAAKKIEREIDRFEPARRGDFRRWIQEQGEALAAGLAAPVVTPKRFHELRKAISRLVAVYDVLNVVAPTSESGATLRVLSTLNGKMGGIHDRLVAGKLREGLDYEHGLYAIPDEIRSLLEDVARKFSSAGP